MPHELNPREVLSYLNELGYTNITAHQLKDFMTDLKILMKYDNRLHNPPPTPEQRDVFEELYTTGTIASNAKLSTGGNAKPTKHKEHVITVQVNRPRSCPAQTVNVERQKAPTPPPSSVRSTASLPADKLAAGPSSTSTCRCSCSGPNSARSRGTIQLERKEGMPLDRGEIFNKDEVKEIMKKPCNVKKNKENRVKSFIRPRLNTRPPRSDPVALYHQYQEHWKKQKIPGTSNHPELRWMIREKLLGDKNAYCY